MESAELSGSRKTQGYVSPRRKCSVMLCGCERRDVDVSGRGEDGTEACPGLQRIYPVTAGERGALHLEVRGLFTDPCL